MNRNRQKQIVPATAKVAAPQPNSPQHEVQDERYPGTFFRVPGVPIPGKTTWSIVR